jgi:F-box and WD-40 domain protein 1/11
MAEQNWHLKLPQHVSLNEDEKSWYYWFKQRYQLEKRWNVGRVASHYLVGHIDSVYCLRFDESKIITGSRDKTIKIWDLQFYQCVSTLEGHQGSVLCLQYNDDIIVSGSSDATVIVWDMKTKRMRGRLHVSSKNKSSKLESLFGM